MSEVKFNLMESCMDDCNENDIVFVDTEQYGLTQEQIMIGMGRMGGYTMKGLSLASNLGNQMVGLSSNLRTESVPSVKDFMDYGEMFHDILSVEEQELGNESRGEVFKILYGSSGDLVCDSITDLIYEPETDECKGGFAKVTKGKHTYPHWYKGK